ncbi:MAG: hypothetical protein M5U26_22990 [Planctomycetota bacterium]|nr:hypothetical protein [Planctomycetota bacterium]
MRITTILHWEHEGKGRQLEVRIPAIYFLDKTEDELAALKAAKKTTCGMLNGFEV